MAKRYSIGAPPWSRSLRGACRISTPKRTGVTPKPWRSILGFKMRTTAPGRPNEDTMSDRFKTEQEAFWAGEFGDDYISRNAGAAMLGSNIALLSKLLGRCPQAKSLIEFGANIGMNLKAVRALRPSMELGAIEINATAIAELRAWGGVNEVHEGSVLDFQAARTWDIALIKGVLIHINPDYL